MYKIRKVAFNGHPILGGLTLNFCNQDNKAVDTVIIAGENGNGKSTILNELYDAILKKFQYDLSLEIEQGDKILSVHFKRFENKTFQITANDQNARGVNFPDLNLTAIFSDVDINYSAQSISAVTGLSLDESGDSRRSTPNLPKQINQLIVDIQDQDDASVANAMRKNPDLTGRQLNVEQRMPRFTSAFGEIFDQLSYSHIENQNQHKVIIFSKNNKDIPISGLSSGEKQIVYRGCFLLRDVNALNGPFVFIDEPELGLHPRWQMKIMNFYKHIFSNANGEQTSQIFVATHSPFIIHNDSRRNDKVIILTRRQDGRIVASDKPEYYKCNTIEAVQDAFSVDCFNSYEPTVYLEGQTDEKYFQRAVEVYGYDDIPFKFKCIGHVNENHQEKNSGKSALSKAVGFFLGNRSPVKNVFLFDCDTGMQEKEENNVYVKTMQQYDNSKQIIAGIENALVLDDIDISPYYEEKIEKGKYGEQNKIQHLRKTEFCDYLCSLDNSKLETIFINLKKIIDDLVTIFA